MKTHPNGRVLGIDILPCPAPSGANVMQGNFLSKTTQNRIKTYLSDSLRGRQVTEQAMIGEEIGYIDMAEHDHSNDPLSGGDRGMVDVVLSDMSDPWPQTEGFWKNYLTEAYFRMSNVSGIRVKDHGDSMVFPQPPLLPRFPLLCFPLSSLSFIALLVLMIGFMRCGYVVCY
jgi:21S rRNA (uridine2791-2'-O)-methyltransferase